MKNKKTLVIVMILVSFIFTLFIVESAQKRDLLAGVDSETTQQEAQLTSEAANQTDTEKDNQKAAGSVDSAAEASSSESAASEAAEAKESIQAASQGITPRKVITDHLFKKVELYSFSDNENYNQDNVTGVIKNGTAIKLSLSFIGGSTTYAKGDTYTTTFPEELGLVEDVNGTFSDGSAKYVISATTGIITIEFLRSTTDFDGTLALTMNIPVYTETDSSIKKFHFDTEIPTDFTMSIYQRTNQTSTWNYYDKDGGGLIGRPYMPATVVQSHVINNKGNNLTNGMMLSLNSLFSAKPTYWTDGYVNVKRDPANISLKQYTRNIKGDKTDEGTLLELNKDYTVKVLTDYSFEINFLGAESMMGLIEYSYGTEEFDYSNFNPAYASASSASSNSISYWSSFYIRKKTDVTKYVEGSNMNTNIDVSPFVFLSYKTDKAHSYISSNSAIELGGNTLYINLSGETLKKGKEIVLSLTDKDGNQAPSSLFRKELAKESAVTVSGTKINEAKGTSLENWEIRDDSATGNVILTYTGEDTTKAFGIEYFVRAKGDLSNSQKYGYFEANDTEHSKARTYSQILGGTVVSKYGVFTYKNKQVSWILKVNRAYDSMENAEIIDTPGVGNGKNISGMTITEMPFVPLSGGAKAKVLAEGEDYSFIKNADGSFKIKLLKNFDEQLEITYTQDLDYTEIAENTKYVSNKLDLGYTVDGAVKKGTTTGSASIPDYVRSNAPIVQSNGYSSLSSSLAIIINPAGRTDISDSDFTFNLADYGLEVDYNGATKAFEMTGYGGTINSIEYDYRNPLTEGNSAFPSIVVKDGILSIKNKDLDRPIVVFLSVRINNFYSGGTISNIKAAYSSNDFNGPISVPTLTFRVIYNMTGKFEKNSTYNNVLDVNFTIPKKQGKLLKQQTQLAIQVSSDTANQIYTSLIGAKDDLGNLIPPSAYVVSSKISGGSKFYYITLKEDLSSGLNLTLPLAFDAPGKKTVVGSAWFSPANNTSSYNQTLDSNFSANPVMEFVISGGEGILQMTNLTIKKVDSISKAPLAGAEFKLIDWNGVPVASGTTDSSGTLKLTDVPTNKYHLVETKAPEGYIINPDYTDEGKEINAVKNEATNQFIVENRAKSKLDIAFTYEDGTPIKDTPMISLEGLAGDEVDLTSNPEITAINQSLQAESSSYLFKGFDIGQKATGVESKVVMPAGSATVYYKYQGLVQFSVSSNLNFESGLVLPFTQTLDYDNSEDFLLSVKDNRQFTAIATPPSKGMRGDFKVYATLADNFKTAGGDSLVGAELSYGGSSRKIINQNAQLLYSNRHDANDAEESEFSIKMDGADKADDGFKLLVPPGTAKKEAYKAKIYWELVEAP